MGAKGTCFLRYLFLPWRRSLLFSEQEKEAEDRPSVFFSTGSLGLRPSPGSRPGCGDRRGGGLGLGHGSRPRPGWAKGDGGGAGHEGTRQDRGRAAAAWGVQSPQKAGSGRSAGKKKIMIPLLLTAFRAGSSLPSVWLTRWRSMNPQLVCALAPRLGGGAGCPCGQGLCHP